MAWLNAVVLAYGLLNIAFGIAGYLNKGSMPSLIAGVGAGVVVLFAAALARTHRSIGFGIAAVVCLAIAGRFAMAALKGQIYPAAILAGASALTFLALTVGHFQAKRYPA